MSSKRHKRRKQCLGKSRYFSEKEATTAAFLYKRKFPDRADYVNEYHCSMCGTWHIGHLPSNLRHARARA